MTCPRVFVSSTYYDLKPVREVVRNFIQDMGYEPVLSEFSDVFYRPGDTVQNSCLREIPNCDLFVLIVGKRYGSPFPGEDLSITHKEYLQAQNVGVPIYSFVDAEVLHDYQFFIKNKRSTGLKFRVVEEKEEEVFGLIDQVQQASKDNSLIPYSSTDDILKHLRMQWANLLKDFLVCQRTATAHKEPAKAATADKQAALTVSRACMENLSNLGISDITPEDISQSSTLQEMIEKKGATMTDNSTEFRVQLQGKVLHIGKQAMGILNEEFREAKFEICTESA